MSEREDLFYISLVAYTLLPLVFVVLCVLHFFYSKVRLVAREQMILSDVAEQFNRASTKKKGSKGAAPSKKASLLCYRCRREPSLDDRKVTVRSASVFFAPSIDPKQRRKIDVLKKSLAAAKKALAKAKKAAPWQWSRLRRWKKMPRLFPEAVEAGVGAEKDAKERGEDEGEEDGSQVAVRMDTVIKFDDDSDDNGGDGGGGGGGETDKGEEEKRPDPVKEAKEAVKALRIALKIAKNDANPSGSSGLIIAYRKGAMGIGEFLVELEDNATTTTAGAREQAFGRRTEWISRTNLHVTSNLKKMSADFDTLCFTLLFFSYLIFTAVSTKVLDFFGQEYIYVHDRYPDGETVEGVGVLPEECKGDPYDGIQFGVSGDFPTTEACQQEVVMCVLRADYSTRCDSNLYK